MAQKGEWVTNTYRAGMAAGVAAILWFQLHFVPVERFEDYKTYNANILQRIEEATKENKAATLRLETKVDVLLREHKQVMINTKKLLEDHYE